MSQEMEKNIMKIIEEGKVTPMAKGYFVAKNYSCWALFSTSLVVGAFSLGTVAFLLSDQDWYAYKYLNMSQLAYVLLFLPYFWVVLLAFFLFASYYYLRTTKKGYKHGYYTVIGGIGFFVLSLGIIFYGLGMCGKIHQTLAKKFFLYDNFVLDKEDVWDKPEAGLLSGKVVRVEDNSNFLIQDKNGKVWNVRSDFARLPSGVLISNGQTVRLIGKIKEGNIFLANMSKP